MPVFIAKYNEARGKEGDAAVTGIWGDDNNLDLLGTIKVPKNLRLLSERLPKSNYGNKKEKKGKHDKSLSEIKSTLD